MAVEADAGPPPPGRRTNPAPIDSRMTVTGTRSGVRRRSRGRRGSTRPATERRESLAAREVVVARRPPVVDEDLPSLGDVPDRPEDDPRPPDVRLEGRVRRGRVVVQRP